MTFGLSVSLRTIFNVVGVHYRTGEAGEESRSHVEREDARARLVAFANAILNLFRPEQNSHRTGDLVLTLFLTPSPLV